VKLTKKERAIELRDKALKVVLSKGTLSPMLTGKTVPFKTLRYHSGDLHIHYRSPFKPSDAAVVEGLPYGLDVYWPNKVPCMEWDDAGSVRIVGFRPGEWEGKLAALTTAVVAR
jgi:hypothetical protein